MFDLVFDAERARARFGGRRRFLRVGALGVAGLALPDWLQLRSAGLVQAGQGRSSAEAVIQVVLAGGPSQIETWDPKPDAPAEYRGDLHAIATALPGVRISEGFPGLARRLDRLALIRSLQHTTSDHAEGSHWIMTGHAPARATPRDNERPSVGSVVARLKGGRRPGLPSYVTLPDPPSFARAAYLGAAENPFSPVGNLARGEARVANLDPPPGVDAGRLGDRRELLRDLDRFDASRESRGAIEGLDRFTAEAYAMITGPAARAVFNLGRESPKDRERYGLTTVGQACLLARRLIEAGVVFVTVHEPGWDHHGQVFSRCRRQLPPLDQALSALIDDLDARGLADRVLLLIWGEFGRTPRVNGQAGRDHWPGAFSAVLGGGGLARGVVVGATDRKGESPIERPLRPEDVIATLYERLGLDATRRFPDDAGRPLPLLDRGRPIDALH